MRVSAPGFRRLQEKDQVAYASQHATTGSVDSQHQPKVTYGYNEPAHARPPRAVMSSGFVGHMARAHMLVVSHIARAHMVVVWHMARARMAYGTRAYGGRIAFGGRIGVCRKYGGRVAWHARRDTQ
jgi:hypothetical protein